MPDLDEITGALTIQQSDGGRFSKQMELYILASSNGMPRIKAAEAAGYKNPGQAARILASNQEVSAAILRLTGQQVAGLAGQALATVAEIMQDQDAPKGVRLDAAKTILNRAGIVEKKEQPVDDNHEKPLNEWSVADLEAFVAAGQSELAKKIEKERVINPSSTTEPATKEENTAKTAI